jgi:hypothetical protein
MHTFSVILEILGTYAIFLAHQIKGHHYLPTYTEVKTCSSYMSYIFNRFLMFLRQVGSNFGTFNGQFFNRIWLTHFESISPFRHGMQEQFDQDMILTTVM